MTVYKKLGWCFFDGRIGWCYVMVVSGLEFCQNLPESMVLAGAHCKQVGGVGAL